MNNLFVWLVSSVMFATFAVCVESNLRVLVSNPSIDTEAGRYSLSVIFLFLLSLLRRLYSDVFQTISW